MPVDESYPCPQCGAYCLVYDGVLMWRGGSRPPRSLARKDVGYFHRDCERERSYHCTCCGTEFFQDVETSALHLYVEGGGGRYDWDEAGRRWQRRR